MTKLPTKLLISSFFLTCTTNPLKVNPWVASRENSRVEPGDTADLDIVRVAGGEVEGSWGSRLWPGVIEVQAVSGAPME